jgi:hypothetical protein
MRPGDREVSTDDAPNLDWREQALALIELGFREMTYRLVPENAAGFLYPGVEARSKFLATGRLFGTNPPDERL